MFLSVGFSGFGYANEDLQETYGRTPLVGIRLGYLADERAEFFAGLQYGRDSGDPFYDSPTFRSRDDADLTVVPIDLGFRLNALSHANLLFFFGVGLRPQWTREEGSQSSIGSDLQEAIVSGWGFGVRGLMGPEWRLRSGRSAFGLELSLAVSELTLGRDANERSIDGSGWEVRGYASLFL
jgi:hypothetical protein